MANRCFGQDQGRRGGAARGCALRVAAACAALLLVALPRDGQAGAWPREDGRTFLSFGTEIGAEGLSFASLYGERGLPRRWTVVLDAGGDPMGGAAVAALTLRIPLEDGTGANRLALSFGGGVAVEDGRQVALVPGLGQARPFARVGAHWGRGIETGLGTGWVGLDALADLTIPIVAGDTSGSAWKLDATLGINRTDRLATILQVQTGSPLTGDTYLRLQGTVVHSLGTRTRVEAGAILGLSGDDTHAVKAGIWLDF